MQFQTTTHISICFLLSLLLLTEATAQVQVETIALDAPLTAYGGIALGPDGNLYITDFNHDTDQWSGSESAATADSSLVRVNLALDQDGKMSGTVEHLVSGLNRPTDITVDADGHLAISSLGWVYTYSTDGELIRRAPVPRAFGVGLGPDGRIYVPVCNTSLAVSVITEFNSLGGFVDLNGAPGCPFDVTFDDDGNAYVIGNWDFIYKYAPDGSNEDVLDTGAAGLPGSDGSISTRMVFANGFLYLTRLNRVFQISTAGEVSVLAGRREEGTTDGSAWASRFYKPYGITAGTTGDTLYVVSGADPNAPVGSRLARTNIRMITGVHSAQFSGVSNETPETPDGFTLHQNYPNPFNPVTSIRFSVPEVMPVRLAVYDVFGREVGVLFDGYKPSGEHEVRFAAAGLPSGTYLYRLQSGAFSQARRMVLLK